MRRFVSLLTLLIVAAAGCGSASAPKRGASIPLPTPGGPKPALLVPAGTGGDQWLSYAHDPQRTGTDALAPPATALTRAWTTPVDGAVLAEPLVTGTTVLVATEHNTVEALDARTGKVLWTTHLGDPVAGRALPCGDIDPSGITATPVIDPVAAVVWVVAFVDRGGQVSHRLVGLRIDSGAVTNDRAVDLPGADPRVEQARGALTLEAGRVVVTYGGLYGDCGDYHGAVVSLPVDGSDALGSWTVPTARQGGIWAPAGPVVSADGSLLVGTSNAASQSIYDDANAVVRLSAALAPVDLWAPADWRSLSAADEDESSTSPVLLADGDVVSVGKKGDGFLLSGPHLGGVGGQLATASVCPGSGAYGGTATVGSVVYEPCRDGLRALQVGPGPTLKVLWRAGGAGPGAPAVAGGLVWDVDRSGELVGLDPATGAKRQQASVGPVGTPFPTLSVSGGQLFVPAGSTIVGFDGA